MPDDRSDGRHHTAGWSDGGLSVTHEKLIRVVECRTRSRIVRWHRGREAEIGYNTALSWAGPGGPFLGSADDGALSARI